MRIDQSNRILFGVAQRQQVGADGLEILGTCLDGRGECGQCAPGIKIRADGLLLDLAALVPRLRAGRGQRIDPVQPYQCFVRLAEFHQARDERQHHVGDGCVTAQPLREEPAREIEAQFVAQQRAELQTGPGAAAVDRQRAVEQLSRLVVAPRQLQHDRQVVQQIGVVGRQYERTPVHLLGFAQVLGSQVVAHRLADAFGEDVAQIAQRLREVRFQPQRLALGRRSLVEPPEQAQRDAQAHVHLGEIRLERDGAFVGRDRLVQPPRRLQGPAVREVVLGAPAVDPQRGRGMLDRVVRAPAAVGDDGQQVPRRRIARLPLHEPPQHLLGSAGMAGCQQRARTCHRRRLPHRCKIQGHRDALSCAR